MKEEKEKICRDPYKSIIFYTSGSFAFISFIGMIFVLKESLKKERKRTMLNSNLIAIAIAELINCISKFLVLLRLVFPLNLKKFSDYLIVASIQIIMTIFSELCTLLSSLIMSYKIYESTRNNHIFLKRKYTVKILIILSYVIPFFLAIVYFAVDLTIFGDKSTGKESFYDEECKIWNWMYRYLSLSYYVIVIIIIYFLCYYCCKTISFLNRKKKELLIIEEDTTIGEEINKGAEVKDELSERITVIIKKIQYFPIVTIVVWSIFIFDRVPDDLSLIINDGNWFHSCTFLLYFKRITVLLHNFTATIRGLIYCLTFFRADNKLFEDISNFTAYVFCCKCCKKNNNRKMQNKKITIGIEKVSENFEE